MLTAADRKTLHDSWKLLAPITDTIGDLFYRRLFQLKPEYQKLFPADMSQQKKKLVGMLAFIVKSTQWTPDDWQEDVPQEQDLIVVILALGRRHTELYHVPEDAYPVVGDALIWTLNYSLGDAFTDEVRAAWQKIYHITSSMMLMGAKGRSPT